MKNRINFQTVIAILIFLITIASSISQAARNSCGGLFEPRQDLYAYKDSKIKPFQLYRNLRWRQLEQIRRNADRPFGFTTKGLFDLAVMKIHTDLESRIAELVTGKVDPEFIEFANDVRAITRKTIENNLPYDEVIMLTYLYSVVMTIDFSGRPHMNDHLKSMFKSYHPLKYDFYKRFSGSHPMFGYYLPVVGASTPLDLVRSRSALLYTIGLVNSPKFADGALMTSLDFFVHDQSAHGGRAWTSDAAGLAIHRGDEAALNSKIDQRERALKIIDEVFENRNLSTELKNFYSENLHEIDHEGVAHSVLTEGTFMHVLVAYFVSNSAKTIDSFNSDPTKITLDPKAFSQPLTAGQLGDFKELYTEHTAFRTAWSQLREKRRTNQKLIKRMDEIERALR